MPICILCHGPEPEIFATIGGLSYFSCPACELIFLHPDQRLSREQELARYEKHQNSPEDPEYRKFLSPLVEAIALRLPPGSAGLDFGSGSGPAVPAMLEEKGFTVSTYDPFFSPNRMALETRYQFVTCTETAEHLFDPHAEFSLLDSILKADGWLGVMTQFFDDKKAFAESTYRRDPTHVCFYSTNTFEWIGRFFNWNAVFPKRNTVLFHKSSD